MADFHTTAGCSQQLEAIIIGARERLYLVSPYLQLSPILIQRLQDAERRGVQITVVYGKKEMAVKQRAQLATLTRCELKFLINLHAKCYASEAGMLITSMNLYYYSEVNNREMGISLRPEDSAYAPAREEVESILSAAEVESLTPVETATAPLASVPASNGRLMSMFAARRASKPSQGFCVRCHCAIALDSERPFCKTCFTKWDAFANREYAEQWCHVCGGASDTSMARPKCRSCYQAAS